METKSKFIPDPNPNQEIIILFATPGMREGPGSPLIRLVREFEPYWRILKPPPIICACEGSYRAILRCGLFHDYGNFFWLPPGFKGALVYASDIVISYKNASKAHEYQRSNEDYPIRVFYLIDPSDPTSTYPETVALKRDCVVAGKTFLATYHGAAEWLTLHWYSQTFLKSPNEENRYCLTSKEITGLNKVIQLEPGLNKNIALVAHDKMKEQLLDFAYNHFDFLKKVHNKRYATGTTGKLLNGEEPGRKIDDTAIDSARIKFQEKLNGVHWVEPQPSGPEGGDVQIARRILDRQCDRVLFFEDPTYAREHEYDIQLLERTSRIPELDVICLHDRMSAEIWVQMWERCIAENFNDPLTLVAAFKKLYNTELVLANYSESVLDLDEIWNKVLESAAFYLVGLVSSRSKQRRREGITAKVGITWGMAMSELIEKLSYVLEILKSKDEEIRKNRMTELLSDVSYIMPGNITVVPIIGLMGATIPTVEANSNAQNLGKKLGGKAEALHLYSYVEKIPDDVPSDELWSNIDILIYTCDVPKSRFGTKAFADLPDGLYENIKNSEGEIGGLFLDKDGEPWDCGKYLRVGIKPELIRSTAYAGGSILVVGADTRRLKPAIAALRGGFVSTIITDLEFARQILENEIGT